MLDFNSVQNRIELIDREDRALLRSNPSAWSMPEDGQEHVHSHMLLPSSSSFGRKAINLLSWCFAPTKAIDSSNNSPVRHMSVYTYTLNAPRRTLFSFVSCVLSFLFFSKFMFHKYLCLKHLSIIRPICTFERKFAYFFTWNAHNSLHTNNLKFSTNSYFPAQPFARLLKNQ